MIKKRLSTITIALLLNLIPIYAASANVGSYFTAIDNFANIDLDSALTAISVKKGVPYDESKDPALRRGTENSEQPQWSFMIVPIVVFVLLFLVLNRSKPD